MRVLFFVFWILCDSIALYAFGYPSDMHQTFVKLTDIRKQILLKKNQIDSIAHDIRLQQQKINLLKERMNLFQKKRIVEQKKYQMFLDQLFEIFSGLQKLSFIKMDLFITDILHPQSMMEASIVLSMLPNILYKRIDFFKKKIQFLMKTERNINKLYQTTNAVLLKIKHKSMLLNRKLLDLEQLERQIQFQSKSVIDRNDSSIKSVHAIFRSIRSSKKFTEHRRNDLIMPIDGKILIYFHTLTKFKKKSQDLALIANPGSIVFSPGNGITMFSGNFQNHGLIIIIKHSYGYYSVLTGMTKLLVPAGEHVYTGQPIAYLGRVILDPVLALHNTTHKPILHYQLLRNGNPVNPLLYLHLSR